MLAMTASVEAIFLSPRLSSSARTGCKRSPINGPGVEHARTREIDEVKQDVDPRAVPEAIEQRTAGEAEPADLRDA